MPLSGWLSAVGLLLDLLGVVALALSQHHLLTVLGTWLDERKSSGSGAFFIVLDGSERTNISRLRLIGWCAWVLVTIGFALQLAGIIVAALPRR